MPMITHVCNFPISTRDDVITTCLLSADIFAGVGEWGSRLATQNTCYFVVNSVYPSAKCKRKKLKRVILFFQSHAAKVSANLEV